MKKYILLCLCACCQLLLSCANTEKEAVTPEEVAVESARLEDFFEREYQRDLENSPMLQTQLGIKTNYDEWDDYSHLKYAEDLERSKRRLRFLEDSVKVEVLDEEMSLNYSLYKQQLEDEIADYKYRFYNYPINQMFGVHTQLPAFLINMHQIESSADAEAYISRLEKFPEVFEEIREGLKLREMNQIVPPKFVFDHSIEASKNLLQGRPFEKSAKASPLLADFEEKIEELEISTEEKKEMLDRLHQALVKDVEPAYLNLIAALEDQRQRATNEDGAWKFPKGAEFYSTILKRTTTTDLSAEEIHKIGLAEVARIHKEMEGIMEQVGFEGSLQDFFEYMRTDEKFYYENTAEGRAAYLSEATKVINSMKTRLGELFQRIPEADILVKAVEPFRERTAGKAFYSRPAIDGSRPGIYYANLYDMEGMPIYQMEALAFHEGIPGHHMQIALAQELDEVPMFRKLGHYSAYVEGWGLYSEILPKEMGFYQDPYSDFGRLAMELWRSIRLVVDTGIHHKKWTREEAIEYYTGNSPNSVSDAVKMVERHIVMPGQATAYKIGMNKILEMRKRAQTELGEDFDIREFHSVLLDQGALPLNVLENLVNEWINFKKRES